MKTNKTILFGGSGYLGQALQKNIGNNSLIAPSRTQVNLLKVNDTLKFIEKNEPIYIIYLAGITKIDQAEKDKTLANKLNYQIPKSISRFAEKNKIPVLYTSSDAVFDGYKIKYKFKEIDKPNPVSEYGKTKLRGEYAILNSSNINCVLRLITLYGNPDKSNFISTMLSELQKGNEFRGIVDQVQNPLLLDIAVKSIKFSLEEKLSGIYHLGSIDYQTNYEFLVKIARKNNLNEKLIKKITFMDFTKQKKGHRKRKSVLSIDKFNIKSEYKILKSTDESINIFYKSTK